MEIERLVDAANSVGESAVWCRASEALYWVDIGHSRIWRWSKAGGARNWPAPERPTSIGLGRDGRLVVGLLRRLAWWDEATGFETIAVPEPASPGNRLNEGRVGPDGAYWVGTMENNLEVDGSPRPIDGKKGRLYRITADGACSRLANDRFAIPNGFVWDERYFYAADTLDNRFYRYPRCGRVLEPREPFGEAIADGLPDGACLDAEGYIWNARVAGGGRLVRIAPDGRIDREILLPCASPTSCTFGGAELDTLFVTSARFGLEPEAIAANAANGSLFALKPGVRGLAEPLFG